MLVCWSALAAQESDSTQFQFIQQNSTYRWFNNFLYSGQVSQLTYELSNSFISTMTQIQGAQKQWKDDQEFHGRVYGPMPNRWNWELKGTLQWFNDEQSGYFNDARAGKAALGVRRDQPVYKLGIFGGYKQDIRRQFIDTGPTMSGTFVLNQRTWSGYNTAGQIQVAAENLDQRRNRTYAAQWYASKEFSPGVSDYISVDLSQKKRSYYLHSGRVEERSESRQQVQNRLRYRIAQPLSLKLNTEYTQRITEIHTPIFNAAALQKKNRENYSLQNLFGVILDVGFSRNEFTFQYGLDQNLYRTEVKDTLIAASRLRQQTPPNDNSNTIEMAGISTLGLGYQDSLQISISATRMQYNTPDSTNYDDRDEVRYRYGAKYQHRFAPGFRIETGGEVLLNHYAYLFSERSAENYWNRIFRLFSGVHWVRNSWMWVTSAEVLANYYDYEYDDLLNQVRSLAFRNMIISQKVAHPIGERFQGQFRIELQQEDQGRLDWDAFVQELILEREIVETEYKLVLHGKRPFTGYLGYRYQHRLDWRIQQDSRTPSERIYTRGPIIQVIYRWKNLPVIRWEATFMEVTQEDVELESSTRYPITHVRLQANWRW